MTGQGGEGGSEHTQSAFCFRILSQANCAMFLTEPTCKESMLCQKTNLQQIYLQQLVGFYLQFCIQVTHYYVK
jgi:hypothetical protein